MSMDHAAPIGPWPRVERVGAVHKTTAEEVRSWEVFADEDLLVFNKDGRLPCHPSKDGPWSCLSAAVREVYGLDHAHLVFRLDRETSGLVIFAKHERSARRLQKAAERHRYRKDYLALVVGEMTSVQTVDQPLGPDWKSPVQAKSRVVEVGEGGQTARTRFQPLYWQTGHTLVHVRTETGRKHQIRAHAQWLGHSLVGDKIYGPDPHLFLEFIATGWTPSLAAKLGHDRQALHCSGIDLRPAGLPYAFRSAWPHDLQTFGTQALGWPPITEALQGGLVPVPSPSPA